ncbi:MAG: hypothetical protein EB829_06760 [Nitrosopumilus sp. H8]|nr:MAG: hypothetical protein EB829_06760 [Nitrosopumilus sp. H8]
MALGAAIAITGISIILLSIYGADVIIGFTSESGEGFIPFDHKTRGIGLGLPALILPIVAYFISRREPSSGLGGMIIAAGAMIIAGGVVVLVNANPAEVADSGRNVVSETAPLIVAGLVQIGLGALKIKRS